MLYFFSRSQLFQSPDFSLGQNFQVISRKHQPGSPVLLGAFAQDCQKLLWSGLVPVLLMLTFKQSWKLVLGSVHELITDPRTPFCTVQHRMQKSHEHPEEPFPVWCKQQQQFCSTDQPAFHMEWDLNKDLNFSIIFNKKV